MLDCATVYVQKKIIYSQIEQAMNSTSIFVVHPIFNNKPYPAHSLHAIIK